MSVFSAVSCIMLMSICVICKCSDICNGHMVTLQMTKMIFLTQLFGRWNVCKVDRVESDVKWEQWANGPICKSTNYIYITPSSDDIQ